MARSEHPYPRPGSNGAEIRRYFTQPSHAPCIGIAGQLIGFGLLLGALVLAGLRTGELPRPVALTAVASGLPNLLGPLYLLAEPAGWLILAGRFPGLIVAGIAGARLSRPANRRSTS